MISFLRISAIFQRHFIPLFRDPARLLDMFYWPIIDLTLFGFMATWAQAGMKDGDQFQMAVLTCISCWYVVYRTVLEIAKSLLIEMWDNHLANLFASPISFFDLIMSWIAQGFCQSMFCFFYSLSIILFFYHKNLFLLVPLLAPFLLLFLVFGWIVGLIIVSILLTFGRSAEMITWTLPWLFATISGAFYPVTLMPEAVQKIAYLLPSTYLFEGVRLVVTHKVIDGRLLFTALFFCIVYLCLVYKLVQIAFAKSKIQGLSRLE